MRTSCPSEAELTALLTGEISDPERDQLEQHLADCALCRQRLDLIAVGDGNWVGNARAYVKAGSTIRVREVVERLKAKPGATIKLNLPSPDPLAEAGEGGRRLGDYEILDELGRGGMGVVFKARQHSLQRDVALKVILAGPLASEAQVRRFRIEAEAVAKLDHANIVPIYETGEHEGRHFFSMKLVDGSSLKMRRAEFQALQPDSGGNSGEFKRREQKLVRLMAVIARAVHHAHQRGVLHRDLKPANVLLDAQDQPHLTDFGLAKLVESDADLTHSQAVMGTPAYMSPEQAAGRTRMITTASDVYSLGAMLYELLTGRPPFNADDPLLVMNRTVNEEPPPPRTLNPTVSRDLEIIALKCLEKDQQRRYQTAASLVADLELWLAGEPILARPVKAWERAVKWTRRNPAIASLVLLAHVLFIAGVVGVLWQWRRARSQAHENREQLVRLTLANGTRLLEEEDQFSAMVWFAQALKLDQGNPQREAGHQLRLSSLLRQSPKLLHMWFHEAEVSWLDFSPDGAKVVTVSHDLTARVWDAHTGKALFPPLRHELKTSHTQYKLAQAFFVHGGGQILTAARDGARLWDARTGELLRFFEHPNSRLAAISPDGTRLLTYGGEGGTLKMWNAVTGDPIGPEGQHGYCVRHAEFAPDGLRFVTAGTARTVIIWDALTMQPALPPLPHPRDLRSAAFSPDGTRLATAAWEWVQIWDAMSGQALTPPLSHGGAARLAWSPDGKRVASAGSGDETIRVWDATTGQPALAPLDRRAPGYHVVFSPDGRYIAAGGIDGTTRLWEAESGKPAFAHLKQGGPVTLVRFSPDGQRLAVASEDGTVRLWDLRPNDLKFWPWQRDGQRLLGACTHGDRFITRETNAKIQVWNTSDWSPAAPSINGGPVRRAWLSDDHSRLLILKNPSETPLRELAFTSWNLVARETISKASISVDRGSAWWFSADGQLVAGTRDSAFSIWATETGKLVCQTAALPDQVSRVVFNPALPQAAVITGSDLRDWWVQPGRQPQGNDSAVIAWAGTNAHGQPLQLFKTTWENPAPETPVARLDYLSAMNTAAPFLIAITAEP